MLKGIDVSSHNGEINWSIVKNQIDFAIIRLGWGDDTISQDDRYFQKNIKGCIDNNIPFGVYIYSYAKNLVGSESIQSEIEHTKRQLSQLVKKPFCVYIDMEDDSTIYLQKLMLTNFALEYCKQITQAGYKAGVYANENWFKNYLNCSTIASYGYSIWCAKYSNYKPVIASNYDIWQYTSEGKVNGVVGNVDMNEMIHDILNYTPYKPDFPTHDENVNVYYKVKTKAHGWLPEVKNLEDYAGWQNSPITGVAIRVDKGSVWYQVHLKNKGWLSKVTGYNVNDIVNGYAGNGRDEIDCIRVYYNTPANIRPFKKAKYKVNDFSWQYDNEKDKKGEDFAGVYGINAVKFQIIIE